VVLGDIAPLSNGDLGFALTHRCRRLLHFRCNVATPALELDAELAKLAQQRFDIDLIFQVHFEIRVRACAILVRLPVLTHDYERTLKGHEDAKCQIEQLVGVWIRR
jgi:hypothetical protein